MRCSSVRSGVRHLHSSATDSGRPASSSSSSHASSVALCVCLCATYQTERSDLGCERRSSSGLTSEASQVDDLDLRGVELRRPEGQSAWRRWWRAAGSSAAAAAVRASAAARRDGDAAATTPATSTALPTLVPLPVVRRTCWLREGAIQKRDTADAGPERATQRGRWETLPETGSTQPTQTVTSDGFQGLSRFRVGIRDPRKGRVSMQRHM